MIWSAGACEWEWVNEPSPLDVARGDKVYLTIPNVHYRIGRFTITRKVTTIYKVIYDATLTSRELREIGQMGVRRAMTRNILGPFSPSMKVKVRA